jgi:transposase
MKVLKGRLEAGAEAFGFEGNIWTRQRVAVVIWRNLQVKLSPRQVGRLLAELGWTRQQPQVRPSQRDPQAIEQWRRETWPQLQKKPSRKDAPLCL